MLRPEQILNAKFTPVSKGTYNAEEVDAFLKNVAASYEESLNNNQELIKKISILADKIESYRNDEDAIKLALLDAHKMAENVNKNASEKADELVSDAENKSKIILDGANRQAAQTIEDAREKAKEIVDNARTAVASLTERAQIETDNTITEAKKKASEIVANAEEKGREIIGTSKQSYEFYSAELEKIHAETSKFKSMVEDICKGQLNLLAEIPGTFVATVSEAPAALPVEEKAEEAVAEEVVETAEASDEESVDNAFDEIIEEINAGEEEVVAEEEHDASAIALMAEINGLANEVLTAADEDEDDADDFEIVIDEEEFDDVAVEEEEDDDDLFSMIEDVDFDGIQQPDSIPSSLDDLIPSVSDITEESDEEISIDLDEITDDEEEFEGFQIDLDSIADDESEDDDITSLFDSLFDD